MGRLEAIEKTIEEITSLEKFLNELSRKHAINIVDPDASEETLGSLGYACSEAIGWLQKEAEKEDEDNAMTHEERKRELCINDSDF